jgi:hypothetical protein
MGEQKEWHDITDEDLLAEEKRTRSYRTYDAVIIGFLIGVALYSIANKGFGLLTFLPLVYLPIAGRNRKRRQELMKELDNRGLM